MKVLLVNGSPHQHGCTYTALAEIAHTLQEEGIDSEIFWIGNKPIGGCIGCHGCQISCKMENGVGLGSCRNEVKDIGPTGTYPDIQLYFLPAMCQHCDNPSCVAVCPTGACHLEPEDGVVRIDRDVCIGCRSCESACPYQVNTFNQELRVMDKCNICAQLRAVGETPACVRNCPGPSCGRHQ